jgi:SAM-dependent methyltransferase
MSVASPSSVTDAAYRISFQVTQTPAHLAVVCAMAGVHWADRDDLVVADLGCGRGHVVHVLAAANPGWTVVGLDHSPVQLAEARTLAARAALPNAHFAEADLATLDDARIDALPPLDVVLLHGVWTWVSDEARAGIVRLLARRLQPGGLVYVGYNALPAAGAEHALQRWLSLLSQPGLASGIGSVDAARQAMEQLARIAPALGLPPSPMLQRLLSDPPLLEPAFVAHEFLTGHWRPVFHGDLCRALQPAKLGFVGSCNLFESQPGLYASEARRQLLLGAPTVEAAELLKDTWLPRAFRADVFAKGLRPVDAGLAQSSILLAAPGALPQSGPVLDTGLSQVALPPARWAFVRERLARDACTVAELLQPVGTEQPVTPSELLAVLVGSGTALPVRSAARPSAAAARYQRVAARWHAGQGQAPGHFALAAPGACGGWPASALDLAIVDALLAGVAEDDPAALARHVRPGAGAAEHGALAAQVQRRLDERLPGWRHAGVWPVA